MRKHTFSIAAAVALLGLVASSANAEMMLTFAPVNNSSGGAALTNFVTSDLMLTTDADWLGSNLVIQLTNGSIYQDGFGSNGPPNPTLFSIVPSLQFDSYVQTPDGQNPSSAGRADLGGYGIGSVTFSTSGINYNWFDTANTGAGTFTTARFSISSNAVGTWAFYAEDGNSIGNGLVLSGAIQNGTFATPEPGTLALAGMGALGLLIVAWRKRQK